MGAGLGAVVGWLVGGAVGCVVGAVVGGDVGVAVGARVGASVRVEQAQVQVNVEQLLCSCEVVWRLAATRSVAQLGSSTRHSVVG